MLVQPITYENLDGETVTEDFYFNMTKLEMMEADLEFGGFDEAIKRLNKTSDGKEAYKIFKDIILACYGVRDGNDFIKTQDLRDRFAASPALSELIISFLKEPQKGALFVKEVLPKSVSKQITDEEVAEALGQANAETPTEKLKISAKDLQNMSKEELQAAYVAKMSQ